MRILVATAAIGVAVTWPIAARQRGPVTSEFIFDTAPYPSVHASTIVERRGGGLVAAWFGGTAERNPDVGIWVAQARGGKWTTPVEVANGVQSPALRHPTWNPVLFQPAQGPLMLFYKVGPEPQHLVGDGDVSADGGRTWAKPTRLPDGILGPIKNKPVQLANGDMLSGSSTEHAGWRVHFERSTDDGQTWTATPPLNDGKQISAIQPSILTSQGRPAAGARPDAKRQGLRNLVGRRGARRGATVGLLALPNPNAGTDAVTLRDGRQLLVYNHTEQGPQPAQRRRLDQWQDWTPLLVLEDEPGAEYSYPAVIQTRDGRVHITYTWKRQRIKHAVVEIN